MEYLLAALIGGLLTFNAVVTPNKAESAIADVLHRQFPAAQVNVDIEGKRGRDVLHGRFAKLDVSLQNVVSQPGAAAPLAISAVPDAKNKGRLGQASIQLRDIVWNGVVIDVIELQARDLVYDFTALKEENALRIVSSGPVTARLVMPATAVEKLVAPQLTTVQGFHLALRDERVTIQGQTPLPIIKIPTPFVLTGKLEPQNRNEVWLMEPKLAFPAAPTMSLPAGPLLAGVNPLYVIDKEKKWPYSVNIKSIRAHDNKLELTVELTFIPDKKVMGDR
jgi:hypothetical protein